MLSSKKYGTLYTGIISNLVQRIWQHKEGLVEEFTKKYNVHHLVYYEIHSDVYEAITREKHIKKWLSACAGMTGFLSCTEIASSHVYTTNVKGLKNYCYFQRMNLQIYSIEMIYFQKLRLHH
nr:GIY-YIG nuclease family protein [Legionella yabuuchiae]